MSRITFKFLKEFANSKGICIEKTRFSGKPAYEWWKKNDCSIIGVCMTLADAYSEIYYA